MECGRVTHYFLPTSNNVINIIFIVSVLKDISFFKRKFYDMRYAYGLVAPIIAYSNFALIAYNFTDLKDIPFEIFAPIFSVGLVTILTMAGMVLRKKQLPTDFKLQYERNIELVRTQLVILKAIRDLNSNKFSDKNTMNMIEQRVRYLEDLVQNNER